MTNANPKIISLFLKNGSLNGIINIESSSWNSGELYSSPRELAEDMIKTEARSNYGVYLLLSRDRVYIGKSSTLSSRIKQHLIGKDWWDRVIILTTDSDKLDHADIDYLESTLISKAAKTKHLDSDNRNKGNKIQVTKHKLVKLEQYIEEALQLLELVGVTVFKEDNSSGVNVKHPIIDSMPKFQDEDEYRFMLSKSETLKYLESKDIEVNKTTCTYARLQSNKKTFWMNPRVEYLELDWDIVLNNQFENEIIILRIPNHTFEEVENSDENGLVKRKDKPIYLDINLSADKLIDARSKFDFKKYIISRIQY